METYQGSCHCQAVRFTVQLDDPKQGLYRCNCSLCRKKGIVMRAVARVRRSRSGVDTRASHA